MKVGLVNCLMEFSNISTVSIHLETLLLLGRFLEGGHTVCFFDNHGADTIESWLRASVGACGQNKFRVGYRLDEGNTNFIADHNVLFEIKNAIEKAAKENRIKIVTELETFFYECKFIVLSSPPNEVEPDSISDFFEFGFFPEFEVLRKKKKEQGWLIDFSYDFFCYGIFPVGTISAISKFLKKKINAPVNLAYIPVLNSDKSLEIGISELGAPKSLALKQVTELFDMEDYNVSYSKDLEIKTILQGYLRSRLSSEIPRMQEFIRQWSYNKGRSNDILIGLLNDVSIKSQFGILDTGIPFNHYVASERLEDQFKKDPFCRNSLMIRNDFDQSCCERNTGIEKKVNKILRDVDKYTEISVYTDLFDSFGEFRYSSKSNTIFPILKFLLKKHRVIRLFSDLENIESVLRYPFFSDIELGGILVSSLEDAVKKADVYIIHCFMGFDEEKIGLRFCGEDQELKIYDFFHSGQLEIQGNREDQMIKGECFLRYPNVQYFLL